MLNIMRFYTNKGNEFTTANSFLKLCNLEKHIILSVHKKSDNSKIIILQENDFNILRHFKVLIKRNNF